MRRVTKKLREQAAVMCSALAADRAGPHVLRCPDESSIEWLAYKFASDRIPSHFPMSLATRRKDIATCWAEAEALLRTGWSP